MKNRKEKTRAKRQRAAALSTVCGVVLFFQLFSFGDPVPGKVSAIPSADAGEPAGNALSLPPKSGLSYQDRKAWEKILHWPAACEEAFDYPDKRWGGMQFYELSSGRFLVEVTCSRGAYQGFQHYLFLDESGPKPVSRLLSFRTFETEEGERLVESETAELWGTPRFDNARRELTVLNRFRGQGDCGTLATYSFPKGVPLLVALRAKPVCDGKGGEDPERWNPIIARP